MPVVLAMHRMSTCRPESRSRLSRTSTWSRASGWHRGTRSDVRLAAITPASWDTLSTSPFANAFRRTSSNASSPTSTRADAVAVLSVSDLPDTSTMRALPSGPTWLRPLLHLLAARQTLANLLAGADILP